MTEQQITELIEQVITRFNRPLTEVEAKRGAEEIVNAAQDSAAKAKRLKELEEEDLSWQTPNIAPEDPLKALAAREQVHTRFRSALRDDVAQWEKYRGIIIGSVTTIGTAALTGNPGPAIGSAIPLIADALLALSGAKDQ
jgi:hypothetical protein